MHSTNDLQAKAPVTMMMGSHKEDQRTASKNVKRWQRLPWPGLPRYWRPYQAVLILFSILIRPTFEGA